MINNHQKVQHSVVYTGQKMVALPEELLIQLASLGECKIAVTGGKIFILCENIAVAGTVNRSQFWRSLSLDAAIAIQGEKHTYTRTSDLR